MTAFTLRFAGFETSSVGYHFPLGTGALKLRRKRRLPPAATTAAAPDASLGAPTRFVATFFEGMATSCQ
jgi:hypothetical protein